MLQCWCDVKAQEDAELLKSVVSPLEEEIIDLKAQLDEARAAAVRASVKVAVTLKLSDCVLVRQTGAVLYVSLY